MVSKRLYLECVFGYLTVPLLLFVISFTKWWIAIPIVLFLLVWAKQIHRNSNEEALNLGHKTWVVIFFSITICFLLGIGSFWSQSFDCLIKNPLLSDLSVRSWPLTYDLSLEPKDAQQVFGSDHVSFVYYLFYYLPAASIGRLLGVLAARIALLLWSAIGLSLCIYGIMLFLNNRKETRLKDVLFVLALFFAFGGFDVIGDCIANRDKVSWGYLAFGKMEIYMFRDGIFYGYYGLCNILYWAFNQCIPIWLIVLFCICSNDDRHLFAISSLSFLYSPWATIGIIPIVGWIAIRRRFENMINIVNVLMPVVLLVVVGSYYLSNSNSISEKGFSWEFLDGRVFFFHYLCFFVLELLLYVVAMKDELKRNHWLQVALCFLLIIPIYKITPANDFMTRGSIPALFIVFLYWSKYVKEHWMTKKKILIPILIVMSIPQLQILWAGIAHVIVHGEPQIYNDITSFECIPAGDSSIFGPGYAELCDRQFFAHDYEDTFFWKYIANK